ncbi:TetR/AcrR family transcriptional regulator [Brevibacterium sp. UCMA 11752]|nr:TetR/AcrR family transcriptional regulator [Brevibacterium sp. UCMA 11752]
MEANNRGRPLEFDRSRAVLDAARLFWRLGYSGTSTRHLSSVIGISTSSLYAAFGSKSGLFDETVRVYARRYTALYEKAVAAQSIRTVVDELLRSSVIEFTQPPDSHPGCLITSAVMSEVPATRKARGDISTMLTTNERLLRTRLTRAIDEGEILGGTDGDVVAGFVQAIWHGLAVQAKHGVRRNELLRISDFSQRAMWSTYSR